MTFPAVPGWDGIHPAMVQFPIVLLFVAPLLLIVSLFARQGWRPWAGAALALMALGALAAWFAVGTGHAAAQLVDKTPALQRAIVGHEAFAVTTRNVFTVLTLAFAALFLITVLLKERLPGAFRIGAHTVFVLFYVACTTALANTAYRGGRLVHEYGVRAMVENPMPQAARVEEGEAQGSEVQPVAEPGEVPPPASGSATPKQP